MSTNFSDAALKIKDSDFKDKMALLSVSFDPERDTPAKLKQYGQGYLGKDAKPDFSVWQLAVGTDKQVRPVADFFGLRYEVDANDKTQINHSLRTAVISPEGKVTHVYSGSDWTPDDLLNEMRKTLPK
jgi:protein SCO1/2